MQWPKVIKSCWPFSVSCFFNSKNKLWNFVVVRINRIFIFLKHKNPGMINWDEGINPSENKQCLKPAAKELNNLCCNLLGNLVVKPII